MVSIGRNSSPTPGRSWIRGPRRATSSRGGLGAGGGKSRIANTRGAGRAPMQGKWPVSDAAPITPNRTLRRLPNAAYRQREYLTEAEVERLIEAARKRGRNGPRDAAAILLAYRHGLRAAELCQLRWAQIDLRQGRLHVNRAKGGCASVHPLHGPEL